MDEIIQTIKTRNVVNPKEIPKQYSRRVKNCTACNTIYLVSLRKTISKGKFCSRKCSDKHQKRGYWNKGRKLTIEQRLFLSKMKSGSKSHLWKGGITPINARIRMGLKYRLWREKVFARDNYKCVECGNGGYLNADHIKPFAFFPKLRFDINNGRTLCVSCHKKTDTFACNTKRKKINRTICQATFK